MSQICNAGVTNLRHRLFAFIKGESYLYQQKKQPTMKRLFTLLLFSAIISLPLVAEDEIIINIKSESDTNARTGANHAIYASLNEQILTVSFSNQISSRITVYSSDDSETILYSNYYTSADSVQADLSSLSSGSYVVEIYAYGKWWIGYFAID